MTNKKRFPLRGNQIDRWSRGAWKLHSRILDAAIADDTIDDIKPKGCDHEFVSRPPHGYKFCKYCNVEEPRQSC